MNQIRTSLIILSVAAVAVACTNMSVPTMSEKVASPKVAPGLKDGEMAIPPDYRTWPTFLAGIDKAEAKQIRDFYVSPNGHATNAGDSFPTGTVLVMETWKPKVAADGSFEKSNSGKLIKDGLASVFLMAKSEGAGALVDPALRNGDWVYSGFQADGKTPGGPVAAACRGCHLPEATKDWVFRYDEYFAKRKG